MNIPLDYCLIYGAGPFPELGIVGAGIATVTSQVFTTCLFALLVFSKNHNKRFGVLAKIGLERELFGRLMRYGLPGGVQFFLEIFAFTFFIFMVGRLGHHRTGGHQHRLFHRLPSLLAHDRLLGGAQHHGAARPSAGAGPKTPWTATSSTLRITLAYMAIVMTAFQVFPRELIAWFQAGAQDPVVKAQVMDLGVIPAAAGGGLLPFRRPGASSTPGP